MNDYMTKVWPSTNEDLDPIPDPTPLAGIPPIEAEPEPQPQPHWHLCTLMLRLWDIAVISLLGASIIIVIRYPPTGELVSFPEMPLGLGIGFGILGITLALHHRCAQRTKSGDQP